MNGYHKLSATIGSVEDFAIFRRFKAIRAWNLLVLQAELVNLEAALIDAAQDDHATDVQTNRQPLDESIAGLRAYRSLNNEESLQWKLTLQIRAKLKEFDECQVQFQRAHRLPRVNRSNLAELRTWLLHEDGGNNFLRKHELYTWDQEEDLTNLLDSGDNDDALSRWISDTFIPWFHRNIWFRKKKRRFPLSEIYSHGPHWDKPVEPPLGIYPESSISTAATSLNIAASVLLPCSSMYLLYYIQSSIGRLSAILALSSVFGAAMALTAKVKKEIYFGTVAAFAAILVVFVGSTNTSGCNNSAK